MSERKCGNCDFYDSEEIVKVYSNPDPYNITTSTSIYTPMKGACKLLSYTTPYKHYNDWCGQFKSKLISLKEHREHGSGL